LPPTPSVRAVYKGNGTAVAYRGDGKMRGCQLSQRRPKRRKREENTETCINGARTSPGYRPGCQRARHLDTVRDYQTWREWCRTDSPPLSIPTNWTL